MANKGNSNVKPLPCKKLHNGYSPPNLIKYSINNNVNTYFLEISFFITLVTIYTLFLKYFRSIGTLLITTLLSSQVTPNTPTASSTHKTDMNTIHKKDNNVSETIDFKKKGITDEVTTTTRQGFTTLKR